MILKLHNMHNAFKEERALGAKLESLILSVDHLATLRTAMDKWSKRKASGQ